ncbi:UxaA family hydrolase [Alicyclobacillus contaminans]|uniref:UxaA family hydrolase n=1 Tax=Alicyclobacillus contaminans TaxID=392016 RepID=UPI00040E9C4B|nr:altronate dehydratase family protein [Alicyclobacillus contaminans]
MYAVRQLHEQDEVAVALRPLAKGEQIQVAGRSVRVEEDIPRGHKVALQALAAGAVVHKYGYAIGRTAAQVQPGQWVHTHNLKSGLAGKADYVYQPAGSSVAPGSSPSTRTFLGYVRENGDVGIRNELWVLNTVGCVNKTAERLAKMAHAEWAGDGIDGFYHFPHPYGCSQLGDDLVYTQKALAGLVRHPNAAGVLVIGLGCENNRLDAFRPLLADVPPEKVRYLAVQEVTDEFEAGMSLLAELAAYARTFQRTPVPVSRLRIGMKCGGSDGFSGLTANPLVGRVADLLVAEGGTAMLTEVPEMFGAETILMERAVNESVFRDVVHLIDDFKDYYTRHGQVIYENPSPGNKDGGITTLEEKSLGCIQKGGRAAVSGVALYGEPVRSPGLQLVQAPGNDMVSVTALVAAGAHMVLFTTGRGTPMGGAVPTVKISTNTELYEKKPSWIDFNAGSLVAGADMDDLAQQLFEHLLQVANGAIRTKNEQNDFREIAIFKDGVTL